MITINAVGDICPVPVVKAKEAIQTLGGNGIVEILVDNDIAVQNLCKMAEQKGYGVSFLQQEDRIYKVTFTVGDLEMIQEVPAAVMPSAKKNTVIVISSDKMGEGNPELGTVLLKGFLYALSKQESLPSTILFYNGGAKLTTEGSDSIEDLQDMEKAGVKIYTCGTCLNYYELTDHLKVGEITNMYTILELMSSADLLIRP